MDNIKTPTNTLIQMAAFISDNVLDLKTLFLLAKILLSVVKYNEKR